MGGQGLLAKGSAGTTPDGVKWVEVQNANRDGVVIDFKACWHWSNYDARYEICVDVVFPGGSARKIASLRESQIVLLSEPERERLIADIVNALIDQSIKEWKAVPYDLA